MEKNKLESNILYNMLYQILILIVPFVTTPYVSRVLLPEGVGTYSVTQAIAKYFWLFALLGMMNYGNRAISIARTDEQKLSRTFSSLFAFQLVMSSIVFLLWMVMIAVWGFETYGIVLLCQIPYVISALIEVSWFFYGTEQFKIMVHRNALIKIGSAALVFLFVKSETDVWKYTLINSMSLFLGQIGLWPLVFKQVRFVKVNMKEVLVHLKPNLVLFISVVSVSLYTLFDKVMLDVLSNRIQSGYYENAEKLMTMCNGIIGAAGSVMLPRISFLMETQESELARDYLTKSMKYIMILAIAIGFGLAGISNEFSLVFFGEEFRECGKLVNWISLAILFYSWENILRTQYLLPKGLDRVYVKGTVIAAVMNVLVNAALIPHFGALGAVFGTVIAQMCTSGYQSWCVRKDLPVKAYLNGLLPSLAIGLIMVVLCRVIAFFVKESLLTVFLQIGCGGLFYCVAHVILFLYQKDELLMRFLKR